MYEDKMVCYTKVSHGSTKDIGNPLLKQMASQCKLSNKDFIDLAKCPLSAEGYKTKLENQGVLE